MICTSSFIILGVINVFLLLKEDVVFDTIEKYADWVKLISTPLDLTPIKLYKFVDLPYISDFPNYS